MAENIKAWNDLHGCSSFPVSFFWGLTQEAFYPIIECPEAAKGIEAGDEVEVDFDSGKIYNRTKGTEFQGQPFPEFMQRLIAAGGLVKYTNSKRRV